MSAAGRPVFFDHDGGIDDFLSLLLLLSYDDVDLLGISVTPADTMIEAAVPATRKILDLAGRSGIAVAGGTLEGRNPFPLQWRIDAHKVNDMPVLNQRPAVSAPLSEMLGQHHLATTILGARGPVSLLMTGPLTNLAWALDNHPHMESKVGELIWMGGALDVPGNVLLPGHDGTAEWNVYWDPIGAKRVWDSSIPITLFPLDATNQVPVTSEFRRSFGLQYQYPLSAAAGTFWAMTSAWELATGQPAYYCWDTLATSYLACPEICTYREVRCDVVTGGPSEGRTLVTERGRMVKVAEGVDAEAFYAHCLETLRR
jgi:inosine-uridine nucleoside N-ribohydrolase